MNMEPIINVYTESQKPTYSTTYHDEWKVVVPFSVIFKGVE